MATFKATILKNKIRQDGTYNVKIRVTHERKTSYISTEHYVSKKQLTRDLEIKDDFVLHALRTRIIDYREKIIKLSGKIHLFSAGQLAEWLVKESQQIGIDFIQFSQRHIDKLKNNGKTGTAENLQTALNSLIDFIGRDRLPVEDFTPKLLERFEAFISSERTIEREYVPGKKIKRVMPPVKSPADHMRRLSQLFNAAKDEYNDEDLGDIKIYHNPFRKYKAPKRPPSKKRNIKPEQIAAIRDLTDIPKNGKKTRNQCEFARDMFMLSFYLVGMNSVDLYYITDFVDGRLCYNRKKVKDRRDDQARISIKVEPEALPLLEKYRDETGERVFNFYRFNNSPDNFNRAINQGLKQVAALLLEREIVDIVPKLEYYYARHSWATIARNECRISKDYIHLALCHSDSTMKVTDIYIEEDYTIIDESNRKVLNTLL